jgi:hypothetical protein
MPHPYLRAESHRHQERDEGVGTMMDSYLREFAAIRENQLRDEVTSYRLAACLRALGRRQRGRNPGTHRRSTPS